MMPILPESWPVDLWRAGLAGAVTILTGLVFWHWRWIVAVTHRIDQIEIDLAAMKDNELERHKEILLRLDRIWTEQREMRALVITANATAAAAAAAAAARQ